jgi:hypothetical protein
VIVWLLGGSEVAGETFLFTGNGAFSSAANWTPSVGAPPRSGQDQNIVMASPRTLDASGQPWEDFDVWVLATGAAILFSGQTLGSASSITQEAQDASYYALAGASVNNFGEIDIGGAGAQATGRIVVQPGSVFVNNGPIDVDGNLLVTGFFTNNSTITVEHGVAQFQSASSGSAAAAIVLGEDATLAFTGFFANTSVSFAAGENGRLLIGAPWAANTLRTVNGFDQGDIIAIPGQGIAVQWQQAPADQGPPSGALVVGGAGGATLANIPFTGTYEPGAFAIAYDPATNLTTITTTKGIDEKRDGTGDSTPVLDLSEYGRLDLRGVTVAGPNDVTLALHDTTIRSGALQRADFLDGALIFDGTTPAGRWDLKEEAAEIARMYYTVLGRAPEFDGLHYWVENVMEGLNFSLDQVAPYFYDSREFKARYGEGAGDAQFVTLLCQNILGRDPAGDPGLQFWLNSLAQGTSRPDIVVGISESPEHQTRRAADIDNGIKFFDHPWL